MNRTKTQSNRKYHSAIKKVYVSAEIYINSDCFLIVTVYDVSGLIRPDIKTGI